MLAGAGVVAAIVGRAGEPAAATPASRWWPAQNILSGTAYQADNPALGADSRGGFLIAGRGQASYCAPSGGRGNTRMTYEDILASAGIMSSSKCATASP